MIGIEFTLNDGTSESYDPINFPEDYIETDTHYILNLTYKYEIEKTIIKSIRHYEICEKCGYELYKDGCKNYDCVK